MARTALVLGLGVTGEAVTRHLLGDGWRVIVLEDRPSDRSRQRAAGLSGDLEVVEGADAARTEALVRGSDAVVPSPGIAPTHPALAVAWQAGTPVRSEVEVAVPSLAGRTVVGITGTNGKTTVTTLVTAMLVASGKKAVAAGNIGLTVIEAVSGPAEVLVLELSSFQLEQTESLKPKVGTWLNIAPDHLDWHPDLDSYAEAKARLWRNQDGSDFAVGNLGDPVVARYLKSAPAQQVGFGPGGDFRVEAGSSPTICGPSGPIMAVADLPRQLPLDVDNALAALATATTAGVAEADAAGVLTTFAGLPHRVQLIGHSGGVSYYDDSKATTPASVVAALQGFDSVVLIAGGKNKGLDLRPIASEHKRIRAVVAIGDAAAEVAGIFRDVRPVTQASSMDEAVATAAEIARSGDAVLLSPGCASFDWYSSYAERGADFARAVAQVTA